MKAQRDGQAAEMSCIVPPLPRAQTGAPRKSRLRSWRAGSRPLAGRLGSGTSGLEGGSGGRARRGEELKRRIWLVVARVRRRACAVGEALTGEKVGRVSAARDVHATVLVFGQQVEPTRLMMTDAALLLQPMQAGVVRVHLEGLSSR